VLLVVSSSYDPEKPCTLPDRALRCDGSCTTSLRHRGDINASSLFYLRTVASGFYGLHDPCDLLG
jgi:hypothetical protein